MINKGDVNLQMIIQVARRLGELKDKVVFVGGCATGLFITDPAMPNIRVTQDVDIIVEIASRREYYRLEEDLRKRGFRQDMQEDAPICRWLIDTIKVDVMPTQSDILGFTNRWYLPAIRHSVQLEIEKTLTIQLVAPAYFLATKLEAFWGRGGGDYMASHDIEDIIAVLDGRPEIVTEIGNSSDDLRKFLADTFRLLLVNSEFRDALPGHLPPDRASQARLPKIIKRLEEIAGITPGSQ